MTPDDITRLADEIMEDTPVGWRYARCTLSKKLRTLAQQQGKAGGVPEGFVLVRKEAIDWLNGESDFECPPERYFRGEPPRYWWRSVFREKAGLTDAALAPRPKDAT